MNDNEMVMIFSAAQYPENCTTSRGILLDIVACTLRVNKLLH